MERRAVRPLGRRLTLGALIVAAVVLAPIAYSIGASLAPPRVAPTVAVRLVIVLDAVTGDYGFLTSSVQVPRGAFVQVTIVNYDPASHGVAPRYATVVGTLGDGMQMGGSGGGGAPSGSWSGLPPAEIAHTFTIGDGPYQLNVPIPIAPSIGHPSTITFTFRALWALQTDWTCEADEMNLAPSPTDAMTGSFTVA
jgi:hypothetical protein